MEIRRLDKKDNQPNEPVVQLSHVRKVFDGQTVLDDLNLQLSKGENLVVLGKSGSGKSVIIKCIVGLVTPDEGDVNVLGNRVSTGDSKTLNDIRRKVGFLFQGAALYDSMSVRENLEFPIRRQLRISDTTKINAMVEESLERVGLASAIDRMPAELSGGMKKRVGLARTLISQPEIMLYDEPTTGLDWVTSEEIIRLIMDIRRDFGTSSIIITHDMQCAEMAADRVVVIEDGKCAEEGTFAQLKEKKSRWVR